MSLMKVIGVLFYHMIEGVVVAGTLLIKFGTTEAVTHAAYRNVTAEEGSERGLPHRGWGGILKYSKVMGVVG